MSEAIFYDVVLTKMKVSPETSSRKGFAKASNPGKMKLSPQTSSEMGTLEDLFHDTVYKKMKISLQTSPTIWDVE